MKTSLLHQIIQSSIRSRKFTNSALFRDKSHYLTEIQPSLVQSRLRFGQIRFSPFTITPYSCLTYWLIDMFKNACVIITLECEKFDILIALIIAHYINKSLYTIHLLLSNTSEPILDDNINVKHLCSIHNKFSMVFKLNVEYFPIKFIQFSIETYL